MSSLAGRVPPPTPFLPTLRHNAAADESLLLHTGPVFDDMTLDEEDFLVPFGRSVVPGPSSLGFTTSTPARDARVAPLSSLGEPSPDILRAATGGNEGREEEGRAGPSRVRTLFSESPLLPHTDLTLGFADESLGQLDAQETIHDETVGGNVDTVQRESQADVSSSTAWSAISAYASASKRYSSVGADVSLASSSNTSTSSRKRRRSPTPNRDDLFARRRRDSDRRSSRSKAIMIDSIVLPDPVAEGSSFRRSVSHSFANSSRDRSASNGEKSGHGELANSTMSARSQNVDERSIMLSSAVRDPLRHLSGLNVPVRSSQGHPQAHPSDEQSAAPTPLPFTQTPFRGEHPEITPHPEPAQPRRSVAKRLSGLLSSIIGKARAGADDGHGASLRDIPSPQFDSGLDTGPPKSTSSISQPDDDPQEDDCRDPHPMPEPEPLRAPPRTAATTPPVELPPGFRPLTRPAAPAFSTARRALQPRVHDEANRPHPRPVPLGGAAPRPATKSAFAAAALARLPPPGRGSTPAARPVVVKPAERASNIASRRNVFDKPGMRPPPAPVTQTMKRTVPLTGHTPGKASRLRAEQRRQAMQQASSGKENTAM